MSEQVRGHQGPIRRATRLVVGVGGICLVVAVAVAVATGVVNRDSPPPAIRSSPSVAGSGTTTSVVPPVPGALTASQQEVVDDIEDQVAAIRGLAWKSELDVEILSRRDLAERVKALNAEEREENAPDVAEAEATLKLIGLLPPDFDYTEGLDELLSGNILGYYDDETKELVVGGDGENLSASTRATLAHELTHALTDQHFDFGSRGRALDDAEVDRSEESFALTALIEGDAELVTSLWVDTHLSGSEQANLYGDESGLSGDAADALARAPRYVLNSLYFPYRQGSDFVGALYAAGGFAAVDEAYRRPPVSTENILNPSTYTPGVESPPPLLEGLQSVAGCQSLTKGSLGEFDMAQMLDLHLSEATATRAAAGWNGDAYALVSCGSARGLLDRWRTDTEADLDEFVAALDRWATAWSGGGGPDAEGRFAGRGRVGRIVRGAGQVDVVLADDQATVDRLVAAVAGT